MTKDEFVYGINDSSARGRKYARLRDRFYDWFQEHKNDDKPKKTEAVAKKFGVNSYTIRHWIEKLGGYAKCDSEKDSG